MLKKRVSIFFLCSFCLFFLCMEKAAIGAYNDVRGFKTAARLLNNGMYLEALSTYQEISDYSDKQDNRARALLFMGTTYSLYLDQYDAALKQFDKIIKTYPTSQAASDALFNSGMVLYETGKFKNAHAFFKKYLEKYPDGLRRQSAEVWADSAKAQMSQIREPEEIASVPLYKRDVEDTIIRVLIKNKAEKITIYSEQNISLYNPFSKKVIYSSSEPVTLTKQGEQLVANGRDLNIHMCMVKTDGKTILVDNRGFRGDLTILADS
ncbi:MAG: tetratricopeptide repeat protein, partial [Proteobacteria bacterium]|nr:tetratricopeptide repeat protein [Pseudomonadota bacterium]